MKRFQQIICLILIAATAMFHLTTASAVATRRYTAQTVIGNVDSDSANTVTITDVTLLQRFLAEHTDTGIFPSEAYVKKALDADGDCSISVSDVTEIQRYLAELSTPLVGKSIDAMYGIELTVPETAIQKMVERTVASYRFEGAITVLYDGKPLARKVTGTANAQTGELSTFDSLYCVGSLAKQVTAAAVLLLQERGALSIDDTLDTYFPECPYGKQITLRQMLKMRSGIAEFYEEVSDGYSLNELPVGSLRSSLTNSGTKQGNREILQRWLFAQPLRFSPGSRMKYCNSDFFLLARIVEKVAQMSYEAFVRQNIFEPLQMRQSGFIDDLIDSPRLAKNARTAQTVYVGVTMGLGDLVTCMADMEKWMASFFGNRLLSDESIRLMTCPEATSGYGFGVVPVGSGDWCHYGIFTSYAAFDYVAPRKRYAIFAVTNNHAGMSGEVNQMCFELTYKILA